MLFNSIEFLIFFPAVVIAYFLLAHKWRWVLLLAASVYFYMAFTPYYVLLLLSVVVVDYFMAVLIESSREAGRKTARIYATIGILFPLIILFIFKYFNFFNDTVKELAKLLNLNYSPHILKLILPIGISFYTFQSLSYVIEVYRGTQKAEKNFGIFALYVTFFPQLVAGPIERPQNLLKQFYEKHQFDYDRIASGLRLMAWGFFRKLVVADRAAIIANEVFNNTGDYSGIHLLIGSLAFIFQVYCDFAGYSDIAIGAARIIGFKLMTNFRRPYMAETIAELWRRWHISLVTWFRDYVYIPMGGSRVAYWRRLYNIFVMFIVSGIWHGANWTFVIWAGLNAFYIIISILTQNIREKIIQFIRLNRIPRFHKAMRVMTTFTLFTFAGIFFRANTVKDGFYIISHLFTDMDKVISAAVSLNYEMLKTLFVIPHKSTILGFSRPAFLPEMIVFMLVIIAMFTVEIIQERKNISQILKSVPWYIKWALYYLMLFSLLFLGVFKSSQFIYFRF